MPTPTSSVAADITGDSEQPVPLSPPAIVPSAVLQIQMMYPHNSLCVDINGQNYRPEADLIG